MHASIIVLLLIVQAAFVFFGGTNPIFPDSNLLSMVLVFLIYVPTILLGLAYARDNQWKLFLVTGASGAVAALASGFMLGQLRSFKIGLLILALTAALMFVFYGLCWLLAAAVYRRYRWGTLLFIPAFLAAVQMLRLILPPYLWFIPPPSRMLSYSLAGFPPLIQMSSLTGMTGVEYMVLFISTAIGVWLWEVVLRQGRLHTLLGLRAPEAPLTGAP
ncbi:hypothetical protein JW933_03225, partial [candidate division FCPU426 bacterium]|nr:hypothetical protein [candidate division FCPU426 bacterium]